MRLAHDDCRIGRTTNRTTFITPGGQSAIIADQLSTRATSGRRGERRPDVPGATDPERSATDGRHHRVQ